MGLTRRNLDYERMDDSALVSAAQHDLDAFGELVRRHQDFVFGAAMRVVRNPVLAEDLAQETFVRAYRALPDFRGESHVRSWLYRIASNLALNAVQRRKEYPSEAMPEPAATGASAPGRQTELSALREALAEAVQSLPPDLRGPLVMREYEGLSYQEIAERTGLPLNTVRTRILRGRRALRGKMESWR